VLRFYLTPVKHPGSIAVVMARRENMAPDSSSLKAPAETSPMSPLWYTHSYDWPVLYNLVNRLTPLMPRPVRFGLANVVAAFFRRLMPREYAAARANIARIRPDADPVTTARLTRSLFRHFAYYFVDLLSLNRQSLEIQQRHVHRVHGLERLEAVLGSGSGFVAATAHLGNWELAGRLLSPFGKTVHVLTAPEQQAAIQRLLREQNNPPSLRFVSNDGAGVFVNLLMALRRGEVVAVQIDRGTGHRSDLLIDFFDAPARFPSGPFILASAASVPVMPFFCLMRPDRLYDIHIGEAIAVARGGEAAALRHMIRVLEHYVAKAPDQWFNFYDVWHLPTS
jgi:lauroyl/myristoyl acyltransferase